MSFVLSLMRKFSDAVGFIPKQGVSRYVERGWCAASEENGDAAGVILFKPQLSHQPNAAQIIIAAVAMDAQRRAHATALVDRVATSAAAAGRSFLQCWCKEDIAAVEFWRAAGFLPVARRSAPTHDESAHVLFRRPLSDFGLEIFDVIEAARPRGPGGKWVSEVAGVPAWSYDLLLPWRLRKLREASAHRIPPTSAARSCSGASTPRMSSTSLAAA